VFTTNIIKEIIAAKEAAEETKKKAKE